MCPLGVADLLQYFKFNPHWAIALLATLCWCRFDQLLTLFVALADIGFRADLLFRRAADDCWYCLPSGEFLRGLPVVAVH